MRGLLRPLAAGGTLAGAPLPSGKRILLLHLDGVGMEQLRHALAHGWVPTLARLLGSGKYKLSPSRAGAPTSTPAFQAGLLYGVEADIPGYTWYDKRLRRAVRMDSGEDAKRLEADLRERGRCLLEGGSVYCSIFSGGAHPPRWALSHIWDELKASDFGLEFAAHELRDPEHLARRLRDLLSAALVHAATGGRIAAAIGIDVVSNLIDAVQFASEVGSVQHEHHFLLNRLLTETLFSEFAANATVIDVARGTPIVYACFIGYDETAHRRGPYSRSAFLKLREIDLALRRVMAAVDAVPELEYEVYLFSDHGQARTRPAEQVLGESIAEHLLGDPPGAPAGLGGGGQAASIAVQAQQLRRLARTLPRPLSHAALALARRKATRLDAALEGSADGPVLVVPAGDLAHVYLTEVPDPLLEPELRARCPGLLERCATSPAVGAALVRTERGAVALTRDRRFLLDVPGEAAELGRVLGHPMSGVYARDLLRSRSAGDVVLIGAGAPGGTTVAYPWEFGSHGGLDRSALETFVIHPASLGESPFAEVERPQDLHRFFRARGGLDRLRALRAHEG